MKKCLQNMNVFGKKVVVRVDYNVPFQNNIILDDSKIRASLETICYLLENQCKVILLSHLGKVKSEEDKEKNSLSFVAERLSLLLHQEVYFSKENFGTSLLERVNALKEKEVLLLENTRFLDVPNKLESNCDSQLSLFWASLGDIFCNDAFASSHRRHASIYGISLYLPSCIGFLVQKELEMLDQYILHNQDITLIMGGAKMDDKIPLLQALIPKCKYILCGGGIANTCLKALGFSVGDSVCSNSPEVIHQVQDLLLHNKEKFMLPLDVIVGSTYDKEYVKYKPVTEVEDNEMILDIGTKTLEKYNMAICDSKTIFLNGTVGFYEDMRFANGTKELFSLLKKASSSVIVGGGDAASSVRNFGYSDDVTYISSGGGATLHYLATGNLVALDHIEEEIEIETLDL